LEAYLIIYFFYKNNFIRTRDSFFAQNLRTIKNNPASAEEQSLEFSVKVVNKTAASTAQLAKYILLHAYLGATAISQLRENKQKLHIAYLTN